MPIWLIWGRRFLNLPQLSVLEAVGYALSILVDIPSGALADIIGRKTIIMVGWALVAVGHIGEGLAGSVPSYIGWGLIAATAAAFIAGADTALVYDTLKLAGQKEEFTRVNGNGLFAYRTGIIIATFMGGMMYNVAPWVPFVCMGTAEFLSVFCWYFMKEPKVESEKYSWTRYVNQIKSGVAEVYKTSYTKFLSVFYILVGGITFSSFYFFNYSYAIDLGFNAMQQSLLFGFTGIAKALIVLVFARYAKKLTKNQVYLSFVGFMLLSYLPAMLVGRNVAIMIITMTEILGVARFAFLDKYINDEFDSKHRATALSFMDMMVNIVYLVILTAGGFIANSFGTSHLYTVLGVVVLVAVLPVSLKLVAHGQRQAEEAANGS